MLKYTQSAKPRAERVKLNYLSEESKTTLHNGALRILGNTGVLVDSPEAVELLRQAGGLVHKRGGHWIVRLPEWLVAECLESTPKAPTWFGVRLERDWRLLPGRTGFMCFAVHVNRIDPRTRQVSIATTEEAEECYRVIDYLPHLPVTIDVVTIGDVPATTMPPHNFLALLRTTTKHLYTCPEDLTNFEVMLKMAHLVAGGEEAFRRRPFMTTTVSPTSPVRLTRNCCDLIIAGARAGSPVHSVNMSLNGATAPITNASAVALTWAELLSSLVLAQVAARGVQVILSTCSTIMDMKTGLAAVGAPEFGMIGSAVAELLQKFQLYGYVGGGVSDSKIPDMQAAYEFSQTAMLSALTGAPLVFGAGSLEGGLTFDLAKLLLDHEAIDNIHRIMNGLDCRPEELALDLIDEIGPGQQFMTHRHTFQRARSLSQGQLFDRQSRGKWESLGSLPAHERAYAKALEIIENHRPVYLDPKLEPELRALIAENDAKNGR